MIFNVSPLKDPIDAGQIGKLVEAIQELARNIPDQQSLTQKAVSFGQYTVKSDDQFLLCNPHGGPIRIVLPLPQSVRLVEIKNKFTSSNAITIVRIDGKPLGNGNVSYVVSDKASGASTRLFCDSAQWWVL